MKHLKYFFIALSVISILCSCSKTKLEKFIEDPTTIVKGELVFSNQSEDPYAVVVEDSKEVIEQFEIKGNSKETKKYSVGTYTITLTQTDGYTFYASKHTLKVTLTRDGQTICWNNKEYWFK